MSRLAHEPDITELAEALGLGPADDPVEAILASCRRRIDRWVEQAGGVASAEHLEALVARRLQLAFEEIHEDGDFERLKQVYAAGKRDPVFAAMRLKFEDEGNPTYGALVRRNGVTDDAPDRYVAVIDCRGTKSARRFFTRWHEIAHRMTTHADSGATEPGYRSEHDPIERMMDEIAAHVGFYGPIFDPAFRRAIGGGPLLTFGIVEAIIREAFPTASFQATLFACARRMTTPVVYLEAALNYKKEVRRRLATPSLFGDDPPPGELRAVKVIPNTVAQREGFAIPNNMRVPASSVIHRLFAGDPQAGGGGRECLSQWESRGKPLGARPVAVEGRKVGDRVIAIVQPVEKRRESGRERSIDLFGKQVQMEVATCDLVIITPSYTMGFGDAIDRKAPAGFCIHYVRLNSSEAVDQLLAGTSLPQLPSEAVVLSGELLAPEGMPLEPFSLGSPAIGSMDEAISVVERALANPKSLLGCNGFSRTTEIYIWHSGRQATRAITPGGE